MRPFGAPVRNEIFKFIPNSSCCTSVSSVASPGRESRPPPYRCPCAAVSGNGAYSSIPSTICVVAVTPVSEPPLSLRSAFSKQTSPTSLAADEAPCEEVEATANPLADYPLFPSSETT
ncbi:hypothetical protein TIFTF001_010993 [Ficus carica]|uniref:Uncharacterized protein n=1 Tax=Ficus carica TaxID=3494 RepID=A0AA87ZZ34_FICCA|nr:hypothetical protein TIFTF001_010993 [Ficus carica]